MQDFLCVCNERHAWFTGLRKTDIVWKHANNLIIY